MTPIPGPSRNSLRRKFRNSIQLLGLGAAAFLTLSAATSKHAEALSPVSPATAVAGKVGDLTIEVRGGGHGGGGHGGHGGFGGGGGGWHGGHPFAHRRVFIGGVWYDYPYYDDYSYYYGYPGYDAPPGCRIVVTDHGPQRLCNRSAWRHYHDRRHHHRKHHHVDR
jgi:hypothetical protein